MTPALISAVVVADRVAWIRRMLAGIRSLPLQTATEFAADERTVAAAESYLRRALAWSGRERDPAIITTELRWHPRPDLPALVIPISDTLPDDGCAPTADPALTGPPIARCATRCPTIV